MLSLLIISVISNSQSNKDTIQIERVNKEFCTFYDEFSELDSVTGWRMNDNGKWIGAMNDISDDNFIRIQIRKIKIKDKEYAFYLKQYRGGSWKYPALQEEWESYNEYFFCIFDKSELNNFIKDSTKFNEPYMNNINVIYDGTVYGGHDDNYINWSLIKAKIGKLVEEPFTLKCTFDFSLLPVKFNNDKFMRFNTEFNIVNQYKRKKKVPFNPERFNKGYFELPFESFKKFIDKAIEITK